MLQRARALLHVGQQGDALLAARLEISEKVNWTITNNTTAKKYRKHLSKIGMPLRRKLSRNTLEYFKRGPKNARVEKKDSFFIRPTKSPRTSIGFVQKSNPDISVSLT